MARTGRRTKQVLLMKVSDRDRNVKVKNDGCVEVIVSFLIVEHVLRDFF